MARSTGGGGGGGRSFGGRSMGGGSRSVSRSFSGSGRTHIGGSGGHRTVGGGSSYRPSGSSNSGYHSNSGYRRGYGYGYGGYRGGYRSAGPRTSGFGCGGFLTMLLIFWIIGSVLTVAFANSSSNKKLNRDKFKGSVDSQYGYYIDTSADYGLEPFIDSTNEAALNSGFKSFYDKTGVFPVLYVIESVDNPNKYTDELYSQLFKSEGNLLILYVAELDDYFFAAGHDIGEVIDEESLNLICDKVNANWNAYNGDLAKIFGEGMKKAGKQIMAKSNFRVIMVTLIIGLVVIVVVLILFKWWKKRVAQKNKEQEDLEKILSTPLETFGTTPIQDLAAKYDDAPANQTPSQPQTPAQPQNPVQPQTPVDNNTNNGSFWENNGGSQNTYSGQNASFWADAANADDPNNNQQ